MENCTCFFRHEWQWWGLLLEAVCFPWPLLPSPGLSEKENRTPAVKIVSRPELGHVGGRVLGQVGGAFHHPVPGQISQKPWNSL